MNPTVLSRPRPRRSLRTSLPILAWLPAYGRASLRPDILAALTVWALLVPEAMAYAGIAGMPPETGLYAVSLPLAAYAILGSSRHLHVGPSSTVAALSFSVVSGFAVAGSQDFVLSTILLALLAGALLVLAGILRLGVLADFLSRPVLDGFVVGVAVTIVVGQLDKLAGYQPTQEDFLPELLSLLSDLGQLDVPTLVLGLACLALLFLLHRAAPKLPASLVVMLLAILTSWLFDFEARGIHVVGAIPTGLPSYGLPEGLTVSFILAMIPGAAAVALVGFAESIAVARSYATMAGQRVDADQELVALGAANLGAGLSGAFTVDGSMSRTAAAVNAGASTQMVSLLTAGAVLVTAAFLTPFFYALPEAALAAIVIHAVVHLISYRRIGQYRGITRLDYLTAVVAAVGVLALGILQGILIAVLLGLLGLLVGAKSRRTLVLGRSPGGSVFRALETHPDGETLPGLLVLRYDGELYFANAPDFADEVRAGVELCEPTPGVVLVDAEPINDVDATGVLTLRELADELSRQGVDLRFARVKTSVLEIMRRAGIEESVPPEHFYATVLDGVEAFRAERED